MVIKVRKKNKVGEGIHFQYKGLKRIITPQDIKEADKFDLSLNKTFKEIERILLRRKALSIRSKKIDPLMVWYMVGKNINKLLKKQPIINEEEDIFWKFLYGRSILIHKKIPTSRISKQRNNFRTASLLAKYPYKKIKKLGPWTLWREILSYEVFLKDRRILKFVIEQLTKFPRTRDNARPFLKALSSRFKKIDSSILTDTELLRKIRSTNFK